MSGELKSTHSKPERWMVVRPDARIPGGLRVVQAGLREEQARRWAADYKRPHNAMAEKELREIRIAALEAAV